MVSQPDNTSQHIPVLIVGGGITGLTAALFLQQQGVQFLLVERHLGTSVLPRARTIDIRTMELFRELGLSQDLREAGKALAPAWGVLRGHDLVETIERVKKQFSSEMTFPSQMAGLEKLAEQSPESGGRCTQDLSEPVLRQAALERGGDLRFYHELLTFSQDEQRITALINDRQTGIEQRLTADYLIAADGANSPIRNSLNAPTTGLGVLGDFLNVYFQADLSELVRGREFSMFLIDDARMTGFLLAINNSDKWSFHLRYYPEKGQAAVDFTEPRLKDILRQALGIPDLPIQLISVGPWQMTVRIAEQLQYGQVFLAGDCAHAMTPYAGKGANSGVQDVHNLAWKLAAVLKGDAGSDLLNTYTVERQPVDAFYAHLSGEMADRRSGLINEELLMKHANVLIGLPDYRYRSRAIGSGTETDSENGVLNGQPGTRIPHVWLDNSRQESTLDWMKGEFIFVTAGEKSGWETTVTELRAQFNLPLRVHSFQHRTARMDWERLTGMKPEEAMLVRPDGFVALRLTGTDTTKFVVDCLRHLLCK